MRLGNMVLDQTAGYTQEMAESDEWRVCSRSQALPGNALPRGSASPLALGPRGNLQFNRVRAREGAGTRAALALRGSCSRSQALPGNARPRGSASQLALGPRGNLQFYRVRARQSVESVRSQAEPGNENNRRARLMVM